MSNSWMNQKVNELPTVKPGKQFITIASVEDKSDEKGNRVLVTFSTSNGAQFTKMFFESSVIADNIKDRDKDYNNMIAQLKLESPKVSEVIKTGRKFYANVSYGVDAQGFNKPYPNITSYVPTEEDMDF